MKPIKQMCALIGLALMVGLLAGGCGGGSSDTGSSTSASNQSSDSGKSSGEPSGKSPTPGFEDNELGEYGAEASSEEREAASAVLEENLEARGSGDYATQCATLAANIVKGIEKEGPALGGSTNCASKLGAEAKKVPPYILADTLGKPIAALRVKGTSAYALYHGNDGKDYAMKMTKEGGVWRVSSLTTIPLEAPPKKPKSTSGSSKTPESAKP